MRLASRSHWPQFAALGRVFTNWAESPRASPRSTVCALACRHPLAGHADQSPGPLLTTREGCCGVLHPLVRIEDFWLAPLQRLLQYFQTEAPFQRVREPPGEHVPAVPIDHRRQVQESPRHRHVGDVRAPHLVGTDDLHVPQKERKNPVFRVPLRRPQPPVPGRKTPNATRSAKLRVLLDTGESTLSNRITARQLPAAFR